MSPSPSPALSAALSVLPEAGPWQARSLAPCGGPSPGGFTESGCFSRSTVGPRSGDFWAPLSSLPCGHGDGPWAVSPRAPGVVCIRPALPRASCPLPLPCPPLPPPLSCRLQAGARLSGHPEPPRSSRPTAPSRACVLDALPTLAGGTRCCCPSPYCSTSEGAQWRWAGRRAGDCTPLRGRVAPSCPAPSAQFPTSSALAGFCV